MKGSSHLSLQSVEEYECLYKVRQITLNSWPLRRPPSLSWLNKEPEIATSLIWEPPLRFKSCESRCYFLQKGTEASFSLPVKCMEQPKVPERGQLLFNPQERKDRQEGMKERLNTRKDN